MTPPHQGTKTSHVYYQLSQGTDHLLQTRQPGPKHKFDEKSYTVEALTFVYTCTTGSKFCHVRKRN